MVDSDKKYVLHFRLLRYYTSHDVLSTQCKFDNDLLAFIEPEYTLISRTGGAGKCGQSRRLVVVLLCGGLRQVDRDLQPGIRQSQNREIREPVI